MIQEGADTMEKPRTERLIELLKEHPDGLTIPEMREMLSCKNNKDVGNTIQVLKQRGVNLKSNGRGFYKLLGEGNIVKPFAYDTILKALSKNKNGLTRGELAIQCDCNEKRIAYLIFVLRKKGHDIKFYDSKYFLLENTDTKSLPKETVQPDNIPVNNPASTINLIPKRYLKIFKTLSESDKIDCLDMLRKSLYYRKSALSLLESNEEVLSFVTSMRGE